MKNTKVKEFSSSDLNNFEFLPKTWHFLKKKTNLKPEILKIKN